MHVTAAAVTHVEPIVLATAKDGYHIGFLQGQGLILIFQQNNAFRCQFPDDLRHTGHDTALTLYNVFFLHQAVAGELIHHEAGCFGYQLFDFFHRFATLPSCFSDTIIQNLISNARCICKN